VTALLIVLVGVALWYLASCWRFPYARCPLPWCRSRLTAGDRRGHFRRKRPCRLHPGSDYRRLGARVIGRG